MSGMRCFSLISVMSAESSNAFGFFPRLTIFAGSFLEIAACELNTCGITENIFLGFLGSHKARFRRGFADSNNEFNFKAK